jgi:hypothetical protein
MTIFSVSSLASGTGPAAIIRRRTARSRFLTPLTSCSALGRNGEGKQHCIAGNPALFERYGLAGTAAERGTLALAVTLPLLPGVWGIAGDSALRPKLFLGFISILLSLLSGALCLRFWTALRARQVLFSLPLTLEALLLLFHAGLDVLPAITELARCTPGAEIFRRVEKFLRQGNTFSHALKLAAEEAHHPLERHVFYHLDTAVREGASMGTALRALADHAHSTWNHSVQMRVRRLENLVVFPVFFGVLGLLCLTAAVPLAPLLELRTKLHHGSAMQDKPAGLAAPKLEPPSLMRGAP